MIDNLLSGIGMPPFKVRESKQINAQLGFAALPNNFTSVEIMMELSNDCPWIDTIDEERWVDPSTWTQFEYLRNETYIPV